MLAIRLNTVGTSGRYLISLYIRCCLWVMIRNENVHKLTGMRPNEPSRKSLLVRCQQFVGKQWTNGQPAYE